VVVTDDELLLLLLLAPPSSSLGSLGKATPPIEVRVAQHCVYANDSLSYLSWPKTRKHGDSPLHY